MVRTRMDAGHCAGPDPP